MLSLATFLRCLKHRLFQAQPPDPGAGMQLRVLRGNPEAPVEPWQELLQHPVGFPEAARPGQPEFSYQPVLEGAPRALHAPLGLGRQGKDHLNPQLVHGPAELGWHPGRPEPGVCLKTPCRSV